MSTITDKAKDLAQDAKAEAREAAHDQAEMLRDEATQEVNQAADAAHRASDAFDSGSIQSQALEQLAQGIDGVASRLQGRSVDELFDDVTLFARRNPLLFLGGAAIAGFAAARFLKSGPSRPDTSTSDPWANHLHDTTNRGPAQ